MIETFSDVVDQWPSTADLAKDLGETVEAVRKWRQRNSIPAAKWGLLLRAARERNLALTPEMLVSLASRRVA